MDSQMRLLDCSGSSHGEGIGRVADTPFANSGKSLQSGAGVLSVRIHDRYWTLSITGSTILNVPILDFKELKNKSSLPATLEVCVLLGTTDRLLLQVILSTNSVMRSNIWFVVQVLHDIQNMSHAVCGIQYA